MRHIDTIIIHCTATPEGRDITALDVDHWHKAKGTALSFKNALNFQCS